MRNRHTTDVCVCRWKRNKKKKAGEEEEEEEAGESGPEEIDDLASSIGHNYFTILVLFHSLTRQTFPDPDAL